MGKGQLCWSCCTSPWTNPSLCGMEMTRFLPYNCAPLWDGPWGREGFENQKLYDFSVFFVLSPLVKTVPRRLLEAPVLLGWSIAGSGDCSHHHLWGRLTLSGGEAVRLLLRAFRLSRPEGGCSRGQCMTLSLTRGLCCPRELTVTSQQGLL